MALVHFVIFSALFAAALAEFKTLPVRPCGGVSPDHCAVTAVRLDPCGKKPCTILRGANASLSFDFTPNFVTSKLYTSVYYVNVVELDYQDMTSHDGCDFTTCPTVAGVSQPFDYNLYIGRKVPTGRFPLRWKVWNDENKEQMCCFELTIKIA